jgi:hypothetical protein
MEFALMRIKSNTASEIVQKTNFMSLLKLTIVAAISGLFVGAGTPAFAGSSDPVYTYFFTANPDEGNTWFDGSSITIQDNLITGWNLVDTQYGVDLSSALNNSHIIGQNVTSATASVWGGSFDIGTFSAAIQEVVNDNFLGGSDGTDSSNGGYLNDSHTDPDGNWSTRAAVPDALNSFQLFALALAALAASRFFFRRQTPVQVRN